MSDIEGKAAREAATERGREGVSIMKQAKRAAVRRPHLDLVRWMSARPRLTAVLLLLTVVLLPVSRVWAYGQYTFEKEATELLSAAPDLLAAIKKSLDVEQYSTNAFPDYPMIFRARPKGAQGAYTLELRIYGRWAMNEKSSDQRPRIELRCSESHD